MAQDHEEDSGPRLLMDGESIETFPFAEFLAADGRRATSFISNFGNWQLPEAAARAMGSQAGHLEWFHDTGELVLIGEVPERGAATTSQVQPSDVRGGPVAAFVGGVADALAGPLGAPGLVYRTTDGAVRETVLGAVVSEQTRVAVMAVIDHGPRVHEVLWGWHHEHRRRDGWTWLTERLRREHAPH